MAEKVVGHLTLSAGQPARRLQVVSDVTGGRDAR
jgi:hypothetical protein